MLNAVGAALKPKVFCVGELADQGAGHPDFGLYAAKQVQRGRPREGQTPERGVVEVKGADDNAWLTAASDQVSRYWGRYRLVLVTNTRDFVLVGEGAAGPGLGSILPARYSVTVSAKRLCSQGGFHRFTRWRAPAGRASTMRRVGSIRKRA